MSTPRTKRQFAGAASDPAQRRITSFFPNNPTGTLPSTVAARGPLNAPILPAKVQSDLVNVGMRVRKALAERGQKLPDPAFHLWNDDTPASSLDNKPLPASSTTYTTTGGGELAPYSGIHKVGGLSVQPGFSTPSSQESMASTTSASEAMAVSAAATGNRKRIFDEEDDAASEWPTPPHAGPWRRREEWIESEISPRSVAPAGWGNARIMAVPRRSGRSDKAQAARAAAGAAQLGQENMVVDDFDEAPFLALEDEEGRMDM